MNFFFFLDHPSKDLESSIDLFNRPPSNTWSKKTIFDVYIHAFYSNGKNWIFKNIGLLKKMKILILIKIVYLMNLKTNRYL